MRSRSIDARPTRGARLAAEPIVAMLHLMSRPVAGTAEVAGTAGDGVQRIQAVDRAIVLLKAVAASPTPPTLLELARPCGINRATAWRLLRPLEHHGLVDRDVVTQRYTVGYGATVVASAVTDDALIRRVRPLLTDLCLRTGEAVTLAVARRFNLVYTDQVEPPNMMAPSWLDTPLPLHRVRPRRARPAENEAAEWAEQAAAAARHLRRQGVPSLAGPRRAGRDL